MYFRLDLKKNEDDSLVKIKEGFISPDRINLGSQLLIGHWGDEYQTGKIVMYIHDPVTNIWEFLTSDDMYYILTPIENTDEKQIH